VNNWKQFHRCNRKIERAAARATHGEWRDEKKFNDRYEKSWSGGLLFRLIDLFRRR